MMTLIQILLAFLATSALLVMLMHLLLPSRHS